LNDRSGILTEAEGFVRSSEVFIVGDDYSTLQVFTGEISPVEARQILIETVNECLKRDGFVEVSSIEQRHNRIIAIGPAEKRPWLALYDSVSAPDDESEFELLYSYRYFTELIKCISVQFGPAVRVVMDDSCSISFELFVDGQVIDRYQDAPTIGWLIKKADWTREEREANAGRPEAWVRYLGLEATVADELREAWPRNKKEAYVSSTTIRNDTARLLGWNKYFCMTGYNIGADGIPFLYKVPFSSWDVDPDDFEELYFWKDAR
jgi:hypothetical protein